MANEDQTYKGQTNIQTPEPIIYPTPMSPARAPVLTKQITADFQVSQEVWNKLRSQMTEMAETNKLVKRAVKNTYNKVNSIPNPPPLKASNTTKIHKKIEKKLNLQTNHISTAMTLTGLLKVKLLKLITRKTPLLIQ